MTDLPTLKSLLERVEKATGPDSALDVAIACTLLDARQHKAWNAANGLRPRGAPPLPDDVFWLRHARHYTSSLDAALALVEEKLPGCQWTVETDACWLRVLTQDDVDEFQGSYNCRGGTCTALAVVLALLRALQSQQADRSPSPTEGEGNV
jgi:hypothetical protein